MAWCNRVSGSQMTMRNRDHNRRFVEQKSIIAMRGNIASDGNTNKVLVRLMGEIPIREIIGASRENPTLLQ